MRCKREIEALEAKRQGPMDYPKPLPSAFHNFRAHLHDVLSANDIPGEWEWDEYGQEWCASWERSLYLGDDAPFTVTVGKPARIDPARPLMEEIERLLGEHKAFIKDSNTFAKGGSVALRKAEVMS